MCMTEFFHGISVWSRFPLHACDFDFFCKSGMNESVLDLHKQLIHFLNVLHSFFCKNNTFSVKIYYFFFDT